MLEIVLNAVWLAFAAGVLIAAPRFTPRTRIALICALALLFPIISVSDDLSANTSTFDEAATVAIIFVIAFLLVEIAHVHSVVEPAYAIALATPSDPRSPPR